MSNPSPERFEAKLDDIRLLLDKGGARGISLGAEYRWLVGSAHARPRRGGGEKTRSSGERDLSDDVVATAPVSVLIRHAAREIEDAYSRIRGAVADLTRAANMLDPDPTVDHVERSLPHPAERGDLERAREAQRRRQDRAELSGDWDEVTG